MQISILTRDEPFWFIVNTMAPPTVLEWGRLEHFLHILLTLYIIIPLSGATFVLSLCEFVTVYKKLENDGFLDVRECFQYDSVHPVPGLIISIFTITEY